jgi:hypothetical protein
LLDGERQLRLGDVQDRIAGRLHLAPRLRQVAGHQHVINIYVTNVRGLAEPLYLAGARITTAFPVVPLTRSLTIGIGVLSYIDQLNVTVVADRDRCPDLDIFTQALNRSVSELIEATPPDRTAEFGCTT